MREPCIMWSPGNIRPGVVTGMGTTMDLYTTFCNIAGVKIPGDRIVDGVDLTSVMLNASESPRNDMFYYHGDQLFAARLGAYKAHFFTQETGVGMKEHDPPLLYNLDADPSEKYDIASTNPDVILRIREAVRLHNEKMVRGPDMLKDRETGISK
jgi:arylsulfatase A